MLTVNEKIIEDIYYDNYWKRNIKNIKKSIVTKNRIPDCFRTDTYSEKLKQIKLRNRLR